MYRGKHRHRMFNKAQLWSIIYRRRQNLLWHCNEILYTDIVYCKWPYYLAYLVDIYSLIKKQANDKFTSIIRCHMKRCISILQQEKTTFYSLYKYVWYDTILLHLFSHKICSHQLLSQWSKIRTSLTDTGSPFRDTFQCTIIRHSHPLLSTGCL